MSVDLKTAAGALLYRHLPEEYRYRDNGEDGELGDLEAYLDGFGHLMDLMRGTLEQAYADGFAERADNGRNPQSWVLPYLASLLGTRLMSPDLDGTGDIRRRELGHAVAWSKGKGTLRVADSTADIMAGAETHVVEGWRRVAVTPRLKLPPFSLGRTAGQRLADLEHAGSLAPLGCPDMRRVSRPAEDQSGTDPLQTFRLQKVDSATGQLVTEHLNWTRTSRTGAPCFPGSYGDISVTTPDTRSRAPRGLGPAPRRVSVFIQPQAGFFPPGLPMVLLTSAMLQAYANANPTGTASPVRLGPKEVLQAAGQPALSDRPPHRLAVESPFEITADMNIAFEDVNLMGTVTVRRGGQLHLNGVGLRRAVLERPAGNGPRKDQPGLIARNTLLDRLSAPAGFARLEYATVLGQTQVARLQASDCLFVGAFDDPTCLDAQSCVRYSRLPRNTRRSDCSFAKSRSNTFVPARFVKSVLPVPCPPGTPPGKTCCGARAAVFGEPGAGVLDYAAAPALRNGAEDGMELGAYHALGLAARLTALERKLTEQLPLGQTLDMRHDPMLSVRPPSFEDAGGNGP